MNRRAFVTGLIAAPFVYKTGLLATSQVLLRPGTIYFPAGIYELDDIATRISEIIDRLSNPIVAVRNDGSIDIVTTRRLQSTDSERVYTLLKLRGDIV